MQLQLSQPKNKTYIRSSTLLERSNLVGYLDWSNKSPPNALQESCRKRVTDTLEICIHTGPYGKLVEIYEGEGLSVEIAVRQGSVAEVKEETHK